MCERMMLSWVAWPTMFSFFFNFNVLVHRIDIYVYNRSMRGKNGPMGAANRTPTRPNGEALSWNEVKSGPNAETADANERSDGPAEWSALRHRSYVVFESRAVKLNSA